MAKKKKQGPVLKKMSPEARRQRTSVQRKLAKEAANGEARRLAHIRQQMESAVERAERAEDVEIGNRLVRGLGSVLRLVASSYPTWNNDVTFKVDLFGTEVSGWTDWRSVNVRFPRNKFVIGSDGSVDNPLTRTSVAEVLGIGYHEVGHILYSAKFAAVRDAANKADDTDDNSKSIDRRHHTAWNALEDQRMELAVTDASPDIAGYFTAMYLRNFLEGNLDEAWWLAVGRLYLPSDTRRALQDQFVQKYGEDVEQSLRKIVRGYTEATTLVEMSKFVRAYSDLWNECHPDGGNPNAEMNGGGNSDQHSRWGNGGDDEGVSPEVSAADGERWDAADEADEEAEDSKTTGGGDEDGKTSSEPGGDDSVATTGSESGRGRDKVSDQSDTRKKVQDAYDDARKERDADQRVNDALRTLASTEAANYLPYVNNSGTLSDECLDEAARLTGEMERALEVANAYNAPSWRRRQEQGAVDALLYRTRRAGDPEFRRQRTGDGSKGYDVAVSLVLDTSGSMQGMTDDLSVSAIAIKQACWNLGIPCTVTTFDSDANLVSDHTDSPEPISLVASGGTYPAEALAAVPLQRAERSDHLVLLMTDGECCNGASEVQELQSSGVYVLGVGLGSSWSVERLRTDLNVDEAHLITECSALPILVEEWLTRTVGVGQ